jgi:hypothetical protein
MRRGRWSVAGRSVGQPRPRLLRAAGRERAALEGPRGCRAPRSLDSDRARLVRGGPPAWVPSRWPCRRAGAVP